MATALGIGVGVPLTGFTPFDHASDVLGIESHPWHVVFMPSVLLAVFVVVASRILLRRPEPLPLAVRLAGPAFVTAACISLIASGNLVDSVLVLIVAILSPLILLLALRRCDLPLDILCGAFLVTTAALILRADWVFIRDYGVPTGKALFVAKFSNVPYDFHYYGLGNPDSFAAFLLLPLALSAFWAIAAGITRFARALLMSSAMLYLLTLVLVYVRLGMAVGVAIVVGAIVAAPLSRALRWGGLLAMAVAVGLFVTGATTSGYLAKVGEADRSSSGVVRLSSIGDGLKAMTQHPLTGVGLDRYGVSPGRYPAHSSLAQAGAEMGIFGLAASALLTAWLLERSWRVARRKRWDSVAPGACVAAGVYAGYTTVSGGAKLGLANGFVTIWALSAVVMVAVSLRSGTLCSAQKHMPIINEAVGGRISVLRIPRPAVAAVATAALAAMGVVALRPASRGLAAQRDPRMPPSPNQRLPLSGTWTFSKDLPSGWSPVAGTTVAPARGSVSVRTGGGHYTYQVVSPAIFLPSGKYIFQVRASVQRGGLAVSVLDLRSNRFLSTIRDSGHGPHLPKLRAVLLVRSPASVQVVLSNFTSADSPSVWRVYSVRLAPIAATAPPSSPR